jgi:DNA-binding response OmpR family regulator
VRVLLVEDNPSLTEMMAAFLRERGFAVDAVTTGKQALAALGAASYDAVILDLGLPDMDGMDVLRAVRARNTPHACMLPALILTARDAVGHRVTGLNEGADDYILKPFDLTEFEARLRAVLRRPGARDTPVLQFGDVRFDTGSRTVQVHDEPLDLTRREAALFEELVKKATHIVVRDLLVERLYGLDEDVSANAIEATISRVRRKLASHKAGVRIDTLRGIGYRLSLGSDPVT